MTQLYAPVGYQRLLPEEKADICNGCGAKFGVSKWLVPNRMWGLNVKEACNIHDYMYHIGSTLEDKAEADRVFLNNAIRLINDASPWLAGFRRRRALKYYEAVHLVGGAAFWKGKNPPETMVIAA